MPINLFNTVLKAAMYHDIGRIDDFTDEFHGKRGASMFSANFPGIQKHEVAIIKALIFDHTSKNPGKGYYLYNVNKYTYQEYKLMLNVLTDADRLDLFRLSNNYLQQEYLHYNVSKKLLKIALSLNIDY